MTIPNIIETLESARRKFVSWFLDPYLDGFREKWGWNVQTLNSNLWPRKEEAHTLIRNMNRICPGILNINGYSRSSNKANIFSAQCHGYVCKCHFKLSSDKTFDVN